MRQADPMLGVWLVCSVCGWTGDFVELLAGDIHNDAECDSAVDYLIREGFVPDSVNKAVKTRYCLLRGVYRQLREMVNKTMTEAAVNRPSLLGVLQRSGIPALPEPLCNQVGLYAINAKDPPFKRAWFDLSLLTPETEPPCYLAVFPVYDAVNRPVGMYLVAKDFVQRLVPKQIASDAAGFAFDAVSSGSGVLYCVDDFVAAVRLYSSVISAGAAHPRIRYFHRAEAAAVKRLKPDSLYYVYNSQESLMPAIPTLTGLDTSVTLLERDNVTSYGELLARVAYAPYEELYQRVAKEAVAGNIKPSDLLCEVAKSDERAQRLLEAADRLGLSERTTAALAAVGGKVGDGEVLSTQAGYFINGVRVCAGVVEFGAVYKLADNKTAYRGTYTAPNGITRPFYVKANNSATHGRAVMLEIARSASVGDAVFSANCDKQALFQYLLEAQNPKVYDLRVMCSIETGKVVLPRVVITGDSVEEVEIPDEEGVKAAFSALGVGRLKEASCLTESTGTTHLFWQLVFALVHQLWCRALSHIPPAVLVKREHMRVLRPWFDWLNLDYAFDGLTPQVLYGETGIRRFTFGNIHVVSDYDEFLLVSLFNRVLPIGTPAKIALGNVKAFCPHFAWIVNLLHRLLKQKVETQVEFVDAMRKAIASGMPVATQEPAHYGLDAFSSCYECTPEFLMGVLGLLRVRQPTMFSEAEGGVLVDLQQAKKLIVSLGVAGQTRTDTLATSAARVWNKLCAAYGFRDVTLPGFIVPADKLELLSLTHSERFLALLRRTPPASEQQEESSQSTGTVAVSASTTDAPN